MIRSEQKSRLALRGAAFWLIPLLSLSLLPPAVFAHAKLIRSQPKANSTSGQPPKFIELWFSEELEPGFNTIEVKDSQGKRVDRGEVTLAEGGKKAQIELKDLGDGKFSVAWKVLSTDEHTIRGKFTFTVRATQTVATPEPSPSPEQRMGTQGSDQPGPLVSLDRAAETAGEEMVEESSITWVDNLVRWLGYLAMMTLFGGFAIRLFVTGPALRQARAEDGAAEGANAFGVSARRTVRLFWVSIVLLALTALASLVLQASAVFGKPLTEALSPSLMGQVIGGTGFGTAWLLQIIALALHTVIVFLLVRRDHSSESGAGLWWLGLGAGAALLLSPSLTGHAAASAGEYRLATIADWLHLLAGGVWVGGLFHLSFTLPPTLRLMKQPARARALGRMISLFTRVAIPSVVIVTLAGLYNVWIHVGSLGALWDTAYGKTLLIKVALALVMIALGGLNNFYFGRRAERASRTGNSSPALESAKLEKAFSVRWLSKPGWEFWCCSSRRCSFS